MTGMVTIVSSFEMMQKSQKFRMRGFSFPVWVPVKGETSFSGRRTRDEDV